MRSHPRALADLGKRDYLCAVLQCLAMTEPIASYFLSGQYQQDLNPDNLLGSGGELAKEYANLLTNMWKTNDFSIIFPREFKASLDNNRHAVHFHGNEGHDPMEFLTFLLDLLHEDTNLVKGKKPYTSTLEQEVNESDQEAAQKSLNNHLKRENSRVLIACMGQNKVTTKCCSTSCPRTCTTFDFFLHLSLEICCPTNASNTETLKINLLDCLDEYQSKRQLGECEMWYCKLCKQHVHAFSQKRLYKLAPTLFIHLRRTECQGRKKFKALVDFPLASLDLSSHVLDHQDESLIYDCYAVINHHSTGTQVSGYLTAYIRGSDGAWYENNCYKKPQWKKIDPSCVVSNAAYVLFYRRRTNTTATAEI